MKMNYAQHMWDPKLILRNGFLKLSKEMTNTEYLIFRPVIWYIMSVVYKQILS